MSKGLLLNMALGAILATGVGIVGLRTISEAVFSRDTDAVGFEVAVAEDTDSGTAAANVELPPDWGTLFADPAQLASYVAEGDDQHKVCTSCHSFEQGGGNMTGPVLYGVFGRNAGSVAGFGYSDAMKAYGATWSYDNMYDYLKDPRGYVDGTSMSFAGIRSQDDRIALVAYLRSLGGEGVAIPAPDPTRDPNTVADPAADGTDADPAAETDAPAEEAAEAPAEATPVEGTTDEPATTEAG